MNIIIKIKTESDLNLLCLALRLAADKYDEFAQTSAALMSASADAKDSLVRQWRKQQSDALRIADEIEAQ